MKSGDRREIEKYTHERLRLDVAGDLINWPERNLWKEASHAVCQEALAADDDGLFFFASNFWYGCRLVKIS